MSSTGTTTTPPPEPTTSDPTGGTSPTGEPTTPPEETTTPPDTTTAPPEPTTSPPEPTTTPPETTSEPETSETSESSSTSQEPTEDPSSSTSTSVTTFTLTPTESDTTVTITSTSSNTSITTSNTSISSTSSSTSSSSSSIITSTAVPASGGLSTGGKIAIAIIIPIFAVALIAFLGIFFWRRYRKRKDNEELRRKEVEEYGYNPNNDTSSSAPGVIGAAARHHGGDMTETDSGYRGWGNTAGGRKASAPLSTTNASNTTGTGFGNAVYSDNGATDSLGYNASSPPELYGSAPLGGAAAAAAAVPIGAAITDSDSNENRDRHSKSPLLSSPTQRPSTADSSTIGAPGLNGPSELDDGLHRGDSVASSRYTNATHRSDGSDAVTPTGPVNNPRHHHYGSDGRNDYYNDVANPYAAGDYEYNDEGPNHSYQQHPPIIQQVGARRNTRIENPSDSHYPQMPRQGNSGIAQNF